MPLDPQAAEFLRRLAAAHVQPPYELPLSDARAQATPVSGPQAAVGSIEDRTIPGPGGALPIRIYNPPATPDASSTARPAIVFFHGGGWVLCNIGTHDALCRLLANVTGGVVVSVDYRLAPEHKFPAGVEDCYATTLWVAGQAAELAIDPARIAVAGDSAGGNLAAAVCLMARDRSGPAIACQILIYPITDRACDTPSYRENAEGYGLTGPTMRWFWNQYLAQPEDGDHPYASPLRAVDLSRLPPAWLLTCEYDVLRDEGEAYAARLRDAGVPVRTERCAGMIHGFLRRTNDFHQVRTTVQQISEELRAAWK